MKTMQMIIFRISAVAVALLLSACAVGPAGPSALGTGAPAEENTPELVRVECKVAHSTGCRHQGRIFPWGAWLDVMGYDSKDFQIKEVVRNGPGATVLLLPLASGE